MAISNYDITAAAFRPERTHEYELSILTGMDSFAYIIRDRKTNELLAYRSANFSNTERENWPEAFNRLVQADERIRSRHFGNCILGWEDKRMTLVPDELYDAATPRAYLEPLSLLGLDDVVRHERFNELGGHLLFAAPKVRLEAVERRLQVKRTHHLGAGLLSAWSLRSRRLGHQSVSVSVRGNQLFAAAHQNGNLQFFNTFPFTNSQDALYYLLLTYQQCGWSPTRVPLYLCGEVITQSDLYRRFHQYVEDIRFCQYGAPPARPPELAGLPEHVYFELLCLG